MNQEELRAFMREFYDSPLSYLEYADDDVRIKMKKPVAGSAGAGANANASAGANTGASVAGSTASAAPTSPSAPASSAGASASASAPLGGHMITAPLVGVYYEAPAPGEKPYVALGDHVEAGDVLCLIEAMKMINEIKAPEAGTIRFIAPRNGETVGFGDLLMEIEADS